ncbi:MAG: shikimate dehydrogenase [Mycobacterium sp.]|nr:shikimate dehydrogenase [Mycobacterium sp.]
MAARGRRPPLNKDTRLCISLAARPSNIGTRFHNYLYDELGLDFIYKAFTTTDITAAIGGVRALGIRGCSVSMPFKSDVMALVDEIEPSAQDGLNPDDEVIIRGSGGMANAVAAAFVGAGFGGGVIVARNAEAGRALADRVGYRYAPEIGSLRAPILVNVTPIGMAGAAEETQQAFDDDVIAGAGAVFDVVALPSETPLITAARAAGTTVITGAEVIALQAAEQFERYTGVRPTEQQIAAASAISRA